MVYWRESRGAGELKNHFVRDGQLLQSNKKWSHLSMKQKTWIMEVTRDAHKAFVAEHGRLPRENGKEAVVLRVEEKVQERGIWLPARELTANVGRYIDRLNRKAAGNRESHPAAEAGGN